MFLQRIENDDCNLILGCIFDHVPARSIGECVLLTTSFGGSGGYHDISVNLHVCKRTSTFTVITSDVGYSNKGILHAMLRTVDMPPKVGCVCEPAHFCACFRDSLLCVFICAQIPIYSNG